jgi:hypothetical protein
VLTVDHGRVDWAHWTFAKATSTACGGSGVRTRAIPTVVFSPTSDPGRKRYEPLGRLVREFLVGHPRLHR